LAVKVSLDAARLPNDGSGLAGWPVGARGLPTKPATTDRISPVEESPSVGWHPRVCSQGSRDERFSAEELLDDVRQLMERNPEATGATVLQLVTFLAPPSAVEPASARGGLAPCRSAR